MTGAKPNPVEACGHCSKPLGPELAWWMETHEKLCASCAAFLPKQVLRVIQGGKTPVAISPQDLARRKR